MLINMLLKLCYSPSINCCLPELPMWGWWIFHLAFHIILICVHQTFISVTDDRLPKWQGVLLGPLSSSNFYASTKMWCKFIFKYMCNSQIQNNQTSELKIRIVKLFLKRKFKVSKSMNGRKDLFLKGTATCGTYKCPRSNFVKELNNGSTTLRNYQNEDKIPD